MLKRPEGEATASPSGLLVSPSLSNTGKTAPALHQQRPGHSTLYLKR